MNINNSCLSPSGYFTHCSHNVAIPKDENHKNPLRRTNHYFSEHFFTVVSMTSLIKQTKTNHNFILFVCFLTNINIKAWEESSSFKCDPQKSVQPPVSQRTAQFTSCCKTKCMRCGFTPPPAGWLVFYSEVDFITVHVTFPLWELYFCDRRSITELENVSNPRINQLRLPFLLETMVQDMSTNHSAGHKQRQRAISIPHIFSTRLLTLPQNLGVTTAVFLINRNNLTAL